MVSMWARGLPWPTYFIKVQPLHYPNGSAQITTFIYEFVGCFDSNVNYANNQYNVKRTVHGKAKNLG